MDMKPVNYTALDLEMTGLSPKTDKIIEIGAWRIRDGKAEASYGMLVNPHRSIPAKIRALTGISDEMVKAGCEPDDAVLGLLEFIGEDVIVGQNVNFDYGFLKQWATNHKRPLDLFACDTLKIARQLLPQEQPKNLEALCSYFCIMRQNAHRALDDARETAEVFEHLKKLAGEQSDELFTPKQLQYKAKRQTPATPHQLEQLRNFRERHEITDDIAWEGLTRSEASRIMDRYYASYGR
jgi:DNA polymerase-3 subunit alpha (Gram-positive type)